MKVYSSLLTSIAFLVLAIVESSMVRAMEEEEKEQDSIAEVSSTVSSSIDPGSRLILLEKYDEALKHYQQALEACRKLHEQKAHPDVAKLLSKIGKVLTKQGKNEEAFNYYSSAAEIYAELYGENAHPELAKVFNKIGLAVFFGGDPRTALRNFQYALEVQHELYGEEAKHSEIANSLISISLAHTALYQYDTALEHLGQALEIRKKTYGEENIKVADVLRHLGATKQHQSDFKKSVENRRLMSYQSKSESIPTSQHQYEEIVQHYQQALAIYKKTTGEKAQFRVPECLLELAMILSLQGNYREALEHAQEALALYQNVHKQQASLHVAHSLQGIAVILEKQEKYEKSLLYYQKALLMKKQLFGEEGPQSHPVFEDTLLGIGHVLSALGRSQEASEYYKQSWDLRRQDWASKKVECCCQ